jgi:hypothetical protein
MKKIVEFFCCIPGTNVSIEKAVFPDELLMEK